jgi:hypothetical protein
MIRSLQQGGGRVSVIGDAGNVSMTIYVYLN